MNSDSISNSPRSSNATSLQRTMQRIMLRMVSVEGGEFARRRAPKSEFVYRNEEENERVEVVLDCLINARLIVQGKEPDGEPYVEPAHDALIRGWDKLLEWTQEEQEQLTLRRLLTPAANDWKTGTGGLWHFNPRLSLLRHQFDLREVEHVVVSHHDDGWLNAVEAEFVTKSVVRRQNTFAGIVGSVAAAFVALSLLTWFAFSERNRAEDNAQLAIENEQRVRSQLRASEAMRLAALSENVPASHPQRRSLLATASLQPTLPNDPLVPEAQNALREALAKCTGRPLVSCKSQVELFLTNADETMLVTSGERAHINDIESHDVPRLWDLKTLESKAMPAADHIAISQNSKWLATAHPDAVRLRQVKHNDVTSPPDVLRAEGFQPYRVAFSPDNQQLIAVEEFGKINVWDVESKSLVQSIGTGSDFIGFEGRVTVTPDSRWIVCDGDDGGTFMCRLGVADAKLIRWPASEWPGGDWPVDKEGLGSWTEHRFAPISPDGHYVFSGSARYDLHADDPNATRISTNLEEGEFPIAVHPKSTHLATIYGGSVRVRPLNSSGMPGEAETIFSHGDLLTARLSRSWEYMIVALRGGRIAVYDQPLENRAITSVAFERLLHGIEGRILRVFLSDSWVALATSEGPPRIWNLSRFGKRRSFVGLHGARMVIQSAAHQSEDDTSKRLDTTNSDAVLLNHERNTYRLELHSLEMSNPFAAMQPAGIHIKSALANGWGIVEPKSANYELINLRSSSSAARSDHTVVSFRKYQHLTSTNNQHLIHWRTSSESGSTIVAVTGVALSAGKFRSHEYRIVSKGDYTTIPIAVSDDGNYIVTNSAGEGGRSIKLWLRGETACRRLGLVDVDWTKGGACGVWANKSHVALYLREQRMFAKPRLLLWPSVASGGKETVGKPREVSLKVQDGAWPLNTPRYANFWKVTRNGHRALAYDDANKEMLIWDLRRTPPTLVRLRAELKGLPKDQLALSRDEDLLAVARRDGEIVIWDLAEVERGQLEPSHRLVDHQGQVSHLSFAANGEVVIGCIGADARLWRLEEGVPNPRSMLFAHNANVNRADYFVDAAGRDWLITESHAVTNWDSLEGVARVSAWPLHTKVLHEMSSLLIGRKLTEFERRTFRVDAQ